MANEIMDKMSAVADLTITIVGLANAAGRQSTLVDNTTTRYQDLLIYVKVSNSAAVAATAYSTVEVYLVRADKSPTNTPVHLSDACGTTDAAYPASPPNAQLLGVLRNKSIPVTSDAIYGEFVAHRPGPGWGIAIFNQTGQTLSTNTAATYHWVKWVGLNPEVQ